MTPTAGSDDAAAGRIAAAKRGRVCGQPERLRRELLADVVFDAAQALRAGDDRAEALALHLLSFEPLRAILGRLGVLTTHQRDRAAAKRVLAELLNR